MTFRKIKAKPLPKDGAAYYCTWLSPITGETCGETTDRGISIEDLTEYNAKKFTAMSNDPSLQLPSVMRALCGHHVGQFAVILGGL